MSYIDKELSSLLKGIFYELPNNVNEFLPIIKTSKNIINTIPFLLTYNTNKEEHINQNINLLFIIKEFFTLNNNLIPLFMRDSIFSHNMSFYECLITLYLNESINNENKSVLEELIKLINKNYSLSKNSFEYIYQKLSQYYTNKAKIILTDKLLLRYLNLLNLLYTDTDVSSINNNQDIELNKRTKTYIYFNGLNSGLSLTINNNSIIPNTNFPNLEKGCTFVFWIHLDKRLIEEYFKLLPEKTYINLVKINIDGQIIYFQLINISNIIICTKDKSSNKIDISNLFHYNEWNNIIFTIMPIKGKKFSTKIYINNMLINGTLQLSEIINSEENINNIDLFENLLGKVSLVLFFSYTIDDNLINRFTSIKGFYKNKILLQLLKSFEEELNSNEDNKNNLKSNSHEKSDEKAKNKKDEDNNSNNNKLISCFCPLTYEKGKNIIDDVFGNFIGKLNNDDGVNIYENKKKNIKDLGGINNLLPIIELMLSSLKDNNPYKLIDKNILTEKTLQEFLIIIPKILLGHKKNILNEKETNFISSLSLFMENIPSKFYTANVLKSIINLIHLPIEDNDKSSIINLNNYINLILLNERIITKFSPDIQVKIWEEVYEVFKKDLRKIKVTLNSTKIYLFLRYYDEKRYEKFCCYKHACLFNNQNIDKNKDIIMKPQMNVKVGKLFDIIQIYIDKSYESNQINDIFKLLALDLSPCLQKKIINLYISHFSNNEVKDTIKENTFKYLLNNKYLELSEYALKISLLDVRIEIFRLFNILITKYQDNFKQYLKNIETELFQILCFYGFNIFPDALIIEYDSEQNYNFFEKTNPLISITQIKKATTINEELLNAKKKYIHLLELFNKEQYAEDIRSFWTLLSSSFKYEIHEKENINIKQFNISKFIFKFLMDFVSKVPIFYVNEFLKILYSCLRDKSIVNISIFNKDKIFFPWLIDTIFYFHIIENCKLDVGEEDIIYSIRNISINIICEFFSLFKENEDISRRLQYILDYSYYHKKRNKGNKLKEIIKITRMLFIKIFGCFNEYIYTKAKIIFEFMFLFKNSENIFKDDGYHFKEINNLSEKDFFENIKSTRTTLNNWEAIDNSNNVSICDTGEEEEDEDNPIIDNKNNTNLQNNDNRSISMSYNNNNKSTTVGDLNLIPDFIYKGINYIEKDIIQNQKISIKENNQNKLENIWEDYILFIFINDYYKQNLWGFEFLCKNANIENKNDFIYISKKLFEFYGEKHNKDILIKEILKYINFEINNKSRLNIFYVNLIMLSVAIDICEKKEEKENLYWEYKQFLFFFILASINISHNSKNKIIISNLNKIFNNIIGYGFVFLQKKDQLKYQEIKKSIITPLFTIEKKKILGISKKKLFKKSIIEKLFEKKDISKDDFDLNDGEYKKNLYRSVRTTTQILKKGIFGKKKSSKAILNKTDDDINNSIIFKGNSKQIVNEVLEEVINYYKSMRAVLTKSNVLRFFFKNEKEEKDEQLNFIGLGNDQLNKNIIKEENRIFNVLKKVIPFLDQEIKFYWNNLCLEQLKRRREFKKAKKKLFSWGGFWSDRKLFFEHPEYLKLQVKNHFTKEMTKILLTPILDIDYYLPKFSKFDKNKLFNKDDYKYMISLNVEEILKISDDNKNIIKEENKNKEIIFNNNKEGDIIIEKEIDENENEIIDGNIENNNENDIYDIDLSLKSNKFNSSQEFKKIKENIKINKTNNYLSKDFNYLKSLYKFTFKGIWDQYKKFYKGNMTLDNIILGNKDTFDILIQSKLMSSSENKRENENLYICCIVKPTHHIKGYMSTEKTSIKFTHCEEDEQSKKLLENDLSYDKELNCCFGSTFKSHIKDSEKVCIEIKYADMRFIILRSYYYQDTSCEIYTFSNKSYLLNFKDNKELNKFIDNILNHEIFRPVKGKDFKGTKLLGYEKAYDKKSESFFVKIIEEWQNNSISTLHYIMWLNIFSGRSFNDLTQYPVLPWIITNYEKDELSIDDYRNLSIPMGMIEINEKSLKRKEKFFEFYNNFKDNFKEQNPDFNYNDYLKKGDEYLNDYILKKNKKKKNNNINNNNDINIDDNKISSIELNTIPFYYGNHYSSATYVSNFLMRVFPFCLVSIEIQGDKFDDPERLFISLLRSFETASTLNDDLRELIPELYTLPEMFLNKNNINLTQGKLNADGEEVVVNDVDLPPWCNNISYNFVIEMRKNLEKKELKINKWIDLIFGSLQRGEKALENYNIFLATSYEGIVKIESISDDNTRNGLMRQCELGITPKQIFINDSNSKERNDIDKGEYCLYESQKLYMFSIPCDKFQEIVEEFYKNINKTINNNENTKIMYPKIIKIKYIGFNELLLVYNLNIVTNLKFRKVDKVKYSINETTIIQPQNIRSKNIPSYLISQQNPPIIFYNNNKYMIKGGFWDGRLEIYSIIIDQKKKEKHFSKSIYIKEGPIIVMEMTKDEKILLCGTKTGYLICFSVDGPNLEIKNILFLHKDEITSININDNLNMFATSSLDGYVNMHILPSLDLVRSIKISIINKHLYENYDGEFYYANNVFLSSYPLASITAYISSKRIFRTFTINGEFISDIEENDNSNYIKCSIIFNDLNFQEYLIYGTDDGRIKIRKFPNMELINNIQPSECHDIISMDISLDKKYCYVWIKENKIIVIRDLRVDTNDHEIKKIEKKEKLKEKEKEKDN